MSAPVLTAASGVCAGAACLLAIAAASRGARRPRRLPTAAGGSARRPLPQRIGMLLGRRFGASLDDDAAAVLGTIVLFAGPVALVDVRMAAVVAIGLRIRPILVKRRQRSMHEQRVVSELPEVIDLVRLGLASGGSTLVALRAVASRPTGPVTEALATTVARVGVGHRIADALEGLPHVLGEPIRPLVRALVSAERYGVELGPTLDRLADEARDDRRRRAQTRARRVPVQMLLPLVVCVLPAFVVLTLVPTLVSTFQTLEL